MLGTAMYETVSGIRTQAIALSDYRGGRLASRNKWEFKLALGNEPTASTCTYFVELVGSSAVAWIDGRHCCFQTTAEALAEVDRYHSYRKEFYTND